MTADGFPGLPQRQPAPLPAGWTPPRWEPPDPRILARVHAALTALAESSSHHGTTRERSLRDEQRYRAEHHEEHDG
jgi:hypothetical protein